MLNNFGDYEHADFELMISQHTTSFMPDVTVAQFRFDIIIEHQRYTIR